MKYIKFIFIVILCLALCACKTNQNPDSDFSDHSENTEDTLPVESDNEQTESSGNEPSENEATDITLPAEWGNIELPDDILDNPTSPPETQPSVTEPSITEPPATTPATKPEEEPTATTAPVGGSDGGYIELPEDTFN